MQPHDVAYRTYHLNKEFYDNVLKRGDLKDNVKTWFFFLFSGGQGNLLSQDDAFDGVFTSQLLAVSKSSKKLSFWSVSLHTISV